MGMFGLEPQYYSHLYYGLVTILSLFVFTKYHSSHQSGQYVKKGSSSAGIILLTLLLVVFVGLRPVNAQFFVDMASYAAHYNLFLGEPFSFNWQTDNKLFDNYYYFLASRSIPVEIFFVTIAAIYFGCMAWACSSLFPKDKTAALLVYLGAFSTFSYGTNGIKAGAAASLFLVAVALFQKRKWLWMSLFILLSWGFHHSMIVPITAFVICLIVKNPRWFYAAWLFGLIMALFHITFFQQLFAGFANEQGAGYLLGDDGFIRSDILGGFRIDFIIYSSVPIVIGWIAFFKKKIKSKVYVFLLNLYLLTNTVWLLCMYAEFTNRIAYLSWFLLPILLIYPFLKEPWGSRQYRAFQWVAFGHLAFTLFMQYIYY